MRKNKVLKLRIYERVYRLERKVEEITRERPSGKTVALKIKKFQGTASPRLTGLKQSLALGE